MSPLFSLVLLFLPPYLIASFLFPSPLLSSVLVTSSYSLFPLLSASICSFLLAYTNISFPFLLSSSLFQFPSPVSLLPLLSFFPCSFLISLNFFSCPHFLGSTPFLLLTFPVLILFPSSSPLPFPFLHLLVHSPIFLVSSLSCPSALVSSPPGLLVPSCLLTLLSPPVADTLPPLLSDTFPPSIHSPPLRREEEEEEEDRFFCPRAPTAEQLSDHSIVFLPVCSSATDRQTHSSFSSLLCRLPTRTMHQKKNLIVPAGQSGHRSSE